MEFVVASASQPRLDEAAQVLTGVELRRGSLADTAAGADAAVLHYTFAHDRYGGRPVTGEAQVLQNLTGDGAPPVILATPPLEAGAGLGPDTDAETEKHAWRMVGMALAAWVASELYPAGSAVPVCLIHIEGARLVFGDFAAVIRGVRRAIDDYAGR